MDDFSSNNLSSYTISVGSASIVENSGTVYNEYGLSCNNSNTRLYSNFGDGLDYYPSSDDTIFVLIQDPSSSPNPYVLFNQKDGYGYRASFQGGGGASLSIDKETNSGNSNISSTGISLSYTTWYWLVLYPPTNEDTTITAEFRSADTNAISNGNLGSSVGGVLHTTSGSDSDLTFVDQSGIGFGTSAGNGSGLTVDLMTVNLI